MKSSRKSTTSSKSRETLHMANPNDHPQRRKRQPSRAKRRKRTPAPGGKQLPLVPNPSPPLNQTANMAPTGLPTGTEGRNSEPPIPIVHPPTSAHQQPAQTALTEHPVPSQADQVTPILPILGSLLRRRAPVTHISRAISDQTQQAAPNQIALVVQHRKSDPRQPKVKSRLSSSTNSRRFTKEVTPFATTGKQKNPC